MARRTLVLALLVTALLAPAAARAQSGGAFDELTASPTPTATAEDSGGGFSISGSATLYIIAGGLLIAFGVVAWWISRDARSAVRSASGAPGGAAGGRDARTDPELRKAAGKAATARKTQARKKGRAQKAARRRNR